MLVTVYEDFLLSEGHFRELMAESIRRIVDETVRATMVRFGEQMNEVLSLDNLRAVVIAELQQRIGSAKALDAGRAPNDGPAESPTP
jgi:hypothetical protein